MALRAKKYFQDYERITEVKNGKTVSRIVYKGDLYIRGVKEEDRIAEGLLIFVCALIAGLMLVGTMMQDIPENRSGLCAALSILALIPAFCVLEGSVEGLFRRGPLKKNNYTERVLMLRIMPVIGGVLNLMLCVGYGIGAARGSGASAAAICTGVNAVLYAALAAWEIHVPYTVRPRESIAEETL